MTWIYQDESQLLCPKSSKSKKVKQLHCNQSELLLDCGYCVTYNENLKALSIFNCPYFQLDCYNHARYNGHRNCIVIQLPRNLSQLNDYMCGPLNGEGLVCSECADGIGPSVTSFGYRCANCSKMR